METKKVKTKVVVSVLALAGLAVLSFGVYGGDLEPSGAPGSTMKTLDEVEPRTPIHPSDLPLTITESSSYYLAETINFSQTDANAITVNADNVTIDLMGFSLIGPGSGTGCGIYMNDCNNVEIRNGAVQDFGYSGIREFSYGGKGHRVIGVRAVSNGDDGIFLNGQGHLVKDCTAAENGGYGIYGGQACTVTGNMAVNNQSFGIRAGQGWTVTGNTAYWNTSYGISALGYCLIDQNTAYGNGTNMYAGPGCVLGNNCAP